MLSNEPAVGFMFTETSQSVFIMYTISYINALEINRAGLALLKTSLFSVE